ncbi:MULTISPECIES: hypothetical protein [Vibrio]|nr:MULTISPECIES: hypothetical protein [Vibrio]
MIETAALATGLASRPVSGFLFRSAERYPRVGALIYELSASVE